MPFAAALVAALTGVLFWQKIQIPASAKKNKWVAAALFVVGSVVLLAGFYRQ